MPKLAPQVEKPVRIRGRHVVLGGIVVAWATVALANRVRETSYPKRTITREAEQRFLDGLELRSLQDCPQLEQHDAWGEPYQVLCHDDGGILQVIVVSYGDGQAITDSRTYPE